MVRMDFPGRFGLAYMCTGAGSVVSDGRWSDRDVRSAPVIARRPLRGRADTTTSSWLLRESDDSRGKPFSPRSFRSAPTRASRPAACPTPICSASRTGARLSRHGHHHPRAGHQAQDRPVRQRHAGVPDGGRVRASLRGRDAGLISGWLRRHAAAAPDRAVLVDSGRPLDVRRVRASGRGPENPAPRAWQSVLLDWRGWPTSPFYLALFALDGLTSRLHLLPPGSGRHHDRAARRSSRIRLLRRVPRGGSSTAAPRAAHDTEVVLFTSGTSGTPEAALHSWSSIAASVHATPKLDASRWLLTFAPTSYAGLQVFLHALMNGGQLGVGPRGRRAGRPRGS